MINLLKKLVGYMTSSDVVSQPIASKEIDAAKTAEMATQIKKEQGYTDAINFLKAAIANNSLHVDDGLSLLDKCVAYMVRAKVNVDEIEEYVESIILKYNYKFQRQHLINVAETIYRFSQPKATSFLENNLSAIKQLDESIIPIIAELANLYLKRGMTDKAIISVNSAYLLLNPNLPRFEYLGLFQSILEIQSDISERGFSPPKYADYLHFQITLFLIRIARDLCNLPMVHGFKHTKSITNKNEWTFFNEELLELALIDLGIERGKFLSEINDYAFNKMPILMDVPQLLISDGFIGDVKKKLGDKKYYALSEINNSPFDLGIITSFVNEIIPKHYKK